MSERAEQTVSPAEFDALPSWLRPLARGAAETRAQQLSPRVPLPPSDARPSAVLMLFGTGERGPDLLLTERAHSMRSHAGQVSFPGGAVDQEDTGPADTALREAGEEVGVHRTGVDVFGRLPALWLPPANFAVTTVLAWWRDPSPLHPEPAEVASAFRTPISDLLDPTNRFNVVMPGSGRVGPAFTLSNGLILWGFTAGVVARLFEHVGWERDWDRSRVETLPARALPDQPLPDQPLPDDADPPAGT